MIPDVSPFRIWVFPKIGVGPQNGWFIMVRSLLKLMILGVVSYFRKHPFMEISPGCRSSSINSIMMFGCPRNLVND